MSAAGEELHDRRRVIAETRAREPELFKYRLPLLPLDTTTVDFAQQGFTGPVPTEYGLLTSLTR